MDILLITFLVVLVFWVLYKLLNYEGGDVSNQNYNRSLDNYDRGEKRSDVERGTSTSSVDVSHKQKKSKVKAKKQGFFQRLFSKPLPFDDEAITWSANFLVVDKDLLLKVLRDIPSHYSHFKIRKRSGGCRIISAPDSALLSIQRTIYKRVLAPVHIHPAATGFRPNVSIVQNAKAHLAKKEVLKVDITNFFGSIKKQRVIGTFQKIGYPQNISKVMAELCTLEDALPQGAPTSPALSNIIALDIDVKLTDYCKNEALSYTRYADDLTLSGDKIDMNIALMHIDNILSKEKFAIQRKKTRFMTEKKRKIITGISISSGEKLTIPKSTKRELRKNVHFILTKGLAEHQKFIGSNDPSYLKRILGQLSFWHMVEPDNEYVKKSIAVLKKL